MEQETSMCGAADCLQHVAAEAPSADDALVKVREELSQQILSQVNAILQGAIKKAVEGHYPMTKFLFAFAGLYPLPSTSEQAADRSLADFFCKQLGLPEPVADADNSAAQAAQDEDGVKIKGNVLSHPTVIQPAK